MKNTHKLTKTAVVLGVLASSVLSIGGTVFAKSMVGKVSYNEAVRQHKVAFDEKGLTKKGNIAYGKPRKYKAPFTVGNDKKDLKKVEIEDNLEAPLKLDAVTIHTAEGTDVTDKWTVTKIGTDKGFKAVSKDPNATWGQSYYAEITVELRKDGTVDLGPYTGKDGSIQILNDITLTVNDDKHKEPTPPIVVPPAPVKPVVVKKVIDKDGKLVDERNVEFNKSYKYSMTYTIASGRNLDKEGVKLVDDMEDEIKLGSVVVKDQSGKDITKDDKAGTLKTDDSKSMLTWTLKTPSDYAGKKITIEAEGTLRNRPSLKKFFDEKSNTTRVPNLTTEEVGKDNYKSNTVHVIPQVLKGTIDKWIVSDDQDNTK